MNSKYIVKVVVTSNDHPFGYPVGYEFNHGFDSIIKAWETAKALVESKMSDYESISIVGG